MHGQKFVVLSVVQVFQMYTGTWLQVSYSTNEIFLPYLFMKGIIYFFFIKMGH